MYGLPENIEMSEGAVFRNFANLMDVDGAPGVFAYRQHGYLFLRAAHERLENWSLAVKSNAKLA